MDAMMSKEIQIFNNPQFGEVRIVINEQNEPMFCLPDVARVLQLRSTKLAQRLSEDVLSKYPLKTNGGIQMVNFINEDGLYDAILDSRKPEARKFRKWVTYEVLPSIRKCGAYMTSDIIERTLNDPDYLIQLATMLKEERQKRINAEIKIEEDTPYVEYAEEVLGAKNDIDMLTASRVLADNGIKSSSGKPIGRTSLFKVLRDNGVFMSDNKPYQIYIDQELFGVALHTFHNGRCSKVAHTPLVKPAGLQWLLKIFKSNRFNII